MNWPERQNSPLTTSLYAQTGALPAMASKGCCGRHIALHGQTCAAPVLSNASLPCDAQRVTVEEQAQALTWRLAERRAIMPRLAEKLLVMALAAGGHCCCASPDAREVRTSCSALPAPPSASPPACTQG